MVCDSLPLLARPVLSPDDTQYWLSHALEQSGDQQRLTQIARSFDQAPTLEGWVPSQPSSPMQLWDFDSDGLLEVYTIGEASSDRTRHALLMAEQQPDGAWATKKVADTFEFTLL